jgi:hypothetical protein
MGRQKQQDRAYRKAAATFKAAEAVRMKPATLQSRVTALEAELVATRRLAADAFARIQKLELSPLKEVMADPLEEVRRGLRALRNKNVAVLLGPHTISVVPSTGISPAVALPTEPFSANYDDRQAASAVREAISMLARLSQ